MIFMQVDGLTKSVGDRILFQNISFGVNEGDKIGIVAKNGTGKSSLMRILAGDDVPDSGKVTLRSGVTVGILPQQPFFKPDETVESIAAGLDDEHRVLFTRQATQMGVNADSRTPVSRLSGGQRKRLAIARVISAQPQILILDEPTNHLDIKTIEWLEGYLSRTRVTIIMVTHDRYFLDRVCNVIFEMDRTALFVHNGNYDYYLRKRAERIQNMGAELDRVRNTLRKEQDWMSRQPQARGGKSRSRIDRFYSLKERSQLNLKENNVTLGENNRYIGNKIFYAHHIAKRFGDKVILNDFDYVFARYDKVGIVGPNGVGKSTFIKMLNGIISPDSGYFDVGETVRFGYYSQDGIDFDKRDKVIDAVSRIADQIEQSDGTKVSAMSFLQKFLFTVPDQQKYIHTLSGGELCRLHLATVLMRNPNFLILDEPTNDLDLVTLGILEEYLANFKGCLIVISHDRFFLDNIVDHLFVMVGDGEIRDFPGNYSDYRIFCREQAEKNAAEAVTASAPKQERPRTVRPAKLTYKEQREMEALTVTIDRLTAECASLEAEFNSGATIDDIDIKSRRYTAAKEELDEAELRWLELSEKA